MKVFSEIVHSFDPGGRAARGPGSTSGGRRSSGRPSGGDDSAKMNNIKNMMQSRGESPGGAERRKSAMLAGQGTHFQSSALRTDMRKDSGAYMEEDDGYSKMEPSTAGRQDMGYDYEYGYEEERMMPDARRGTRMDMDRQPMRYEMDEEDMGYMEEEPRRMARMPRTVRTAPQQRTGYAQEQPRMQRRPQRQTRYIEDQPRMEAPQQGRYVQDQPRMETPQQVRYVQEQPRMQATGADREMGMGYEEQPQGETYRPSHMGGKPAMRTPVGQMQTRYVQNQPRTEAAGASRDTRYEEQPPGHVYRTSHIGAKRPTKPATTPQMHTRYIQEQSRIKTYPPSREMEYREEQPRGQMVRVSPAKPAMKPARQPQMKDVQKEPQRYVTRAQMEPQREVMRAPRISGGAGQPRMRYDQVPRQPEPARVPHINGKAATKVATGQQGMGYTQEQQRPATVSIPRTEVEMQPVRTSKTAVPSMRSQRNRRMSVREPTANQEQRRESIQSTQSTRSNKVPLRGVHDSRDAAVSAAAAAILGGEPKSQRKPVTRIPMAPTGEFGTGTGLPRRDSSTLTQEPVYYYPEEQYMMEEPAPREMEGRLSEDIYGPDGTYETIEREPPVVAETVMAPRPMERAVEEIPEEKEAEMEPERVVVNEPVTVGQPIHEHVVLDEGARREEEREGEWYEPGRLVEPRRLVEPQPALVDPVVTEEVVEEEMGHASIGMPNDEDVAREARARQAEATAPGYEMREAEEEFQPAREIPSDVSEDEWDASEEEEDAEEQWQMSEPQPLGPLSAVPVMAQQPATTTAPAVPRYQPVTTTTAAMAPAVPRQQPATTAAPTMLPGVPRRQHATTVAPAMASDFKAAAPSVPAEEYGTAAAPTAASAMVTDIGAETVTHPATYETMYEAQDFEQPVTTSAIVPPATRKPVKADLAPPTTQAPVMESAATTIPATTETVDEYYESARPSMESRRAIPITTSAEEPTVLGTREPVSATEHQERAYATRASADAGATGRMSTDEPMYGTTRTSMEKQDQGMYEQPRTSMADEQGRGQTQTRAMQEEESESRARTAAAAAAAPKEAPSGTSTGQAYAGSQVPADTGAAAAAPGSMATGGPGTSTDGMNRTYRRRLEKEEKVRQKQRAKEEKAHQQNLKAQNERLEKQRLQAEKKAEKEAKLSKKHQEKETMNRRKSQQKDQQTRRKSQQKEEKDMQRRQSTQQQQGQQAQGQDEGEGGGLSGLWRRMSKTFTGSESNSGSGASQGARTQPGAHSTTPGRGMETMGRPQEIAH